MLWETISKKLSEKNWTIYKLCLKAGIGTAGIYRLRDGVIKDLQFETVKKIADALEVSLDEFRQKGANMKPKRYPYTTKRLSPSTERVNCYIKELETLKLDFSNRGLSEELWKKVKAIAENPATELKSYDLEFAPKELVARLRELQEYF